MDAVNKPSVVNLRQKLLDVIYPALARLPEPMNTKEAVVALLTIGLQESGFISRYQVLSGGRKGPARGYWQFEQGSRFFGGGIWGVFKHPASSFWLSRICEWRGINFAPEDIYMAIETDDILACCVARLLLFTDPKKLPAVEDEQGLWELYAKRTWRPGKPKRDTFPGFHQRARQAVGV